MKEDIEGRANSDSEVLTCHYPLKDQMKHICRVLLESQMGIGVFQKIRGT